MNASFQRGRGGPGSFGTAAFFLLLVVAVYADPLFLRRNFAGRDLLGYNLPVEKSVHDAYARGRLPVWVPEVSGGRPLLPNPNTGAFYPFRPLLSLASFPLAMRIYPVLHWVLAGIGTIWLLRSLGASRGAAWVGAVTYAFSGVAVSEVFYSNYQPGMTLLPWILWAFHRVGGMAPKVLLLSSLLGLDLLAGDVFTSALAILCCLLWLALELQKTEQKRALAILGLSLLLASFLAAPQIVATALWIPLTDRAVLGMKVGEALQYSIHPLRLLEFLVPFPFGPTWALEPGRLWGWQILQGKSIGFFSSLYAGAFSVIALVETRRARLPGVRFARGLLLFGLAFSVLPTLVPLAWANLPFPLPLRYPEKLAVALVMALAILSGLALDRLRTAAHAPRWTIAVGAAMAAAAACAAVFPIRSGTVAVGLIGGAESAYAKVAGDELAAALAEAGLLWVATIVALDRLRRQRRVWVGISLALLTVAPIAANRRIAQSFREEEVLAAPSFDRFLSRVDPSGSYRTLGETSFQALSVTEVGIKAGDPGRLRLSVRNWEQYTHVLWGRGTIFNFDYDHGDLSRLDSLRRIFVRASGFRDSRPFYGALALGFGIRYRDQVALSGYHRIGGDGLQDWDKHVLAFPDIRLAEQWREEESSVDALKVLPSLTDGEIVIESDRRGRGVARPGRLEVLEKTPERLLLEAEAQDPTWLFVIRGFWTYRTVLLDGRMVDTFPAQLAFTALRVPAGRHRIDWREEVPGYRFSRWSPVAFLLSTVSLLIFSARRRDRGALGA